MYLRKKPKEFFLIRIFFFFSRSFHAFLNKDNSAERIRIGQSTKYEDEVFDLRFRSVRAHSQLCGHNCFCLALTLHEMRCTASSWKMDLFKFQFQHGFSQWLFDSRGNWPQRVNIGIFSHCFLGISCESFNFCPFQSTIFSRRCHFN